MMYTSRVSRIGYAVNRPFQDRRFRVIDGGHSSRQRRHRTGYSMSTPESLIGSSFLGLDLLGDPSRWMLQEDRRLHVV